MSSPSVILPTAPSIDRARIAITMYDRVILSLTVTEARASSNHTRISPAMKTSVDSAWGHGWQMLLARKNSFSHLPHMYPS